MTERNLKVYLLNTQCSNAVHACRAVECKLLVYMDSHHKTVKTFFKNNHALVRYCSMRSRDLGHQYYVT